MNAQTNCGLISMDDCQNLICRWRLLAHPISGAFGKAYKTFPMAKP